MLHQGDVETVSGDALDVCMRHDLAEEDCDKVRSSYCVTAEG